MARGHRLLAARAVRARLRRGDDHDAAGGDRRDGGRPARAAHRQAARRADCDDLFGEPPFPHELRPRPDEPGLQGPLRGACPVNEDRSDEMTAVFEEHRRLLVGAAYRLLGSHSDAEDVVQEAWIRWSAVDASTVDEPRAYLLTITPRLARPAVPCCRPPPGGRSPPCPSGGPAARATSALGCPSRCRATPEPTG